MMQMSQGAEAPPMPPSEGATPPMPPAEGGGPPATFEDLPDGSIRVTFDDGTTFVAQPGTPEFEKAQEVRKAIEASGVASRTGDGGPTDAAMRDAVSSSMPGASCQ